MTHNQRILGGGVIGVVVFTAPLFLISPVTRLLIVSWGAALIATGAVTTALYLAANRKSGMFITTAGLALVVWRYAVLNLLFSGIILALQYSGKWEMSVGVFILIHIVLAGITGWQLLAADAGREEIEKTEIRVKEKISHWKMFQMKTATLAAQAAQPVRKRVENVRDAVRYADPVSLPQLTDIEAEIGENIDLMAQTLQSGDHEKTAELTEKLLLQIKQRAELCKNLK